MSKVSIVKIKDNLKDALRLSLDLLGGPEKFINQEDIVLIKPNLNDFENFTSLGLTHALIRLLKDLHVRQILIGESTFGDAKMTDLHFQKSGYTALARELGIELINFNRSDWVELKVDHPQITGSVKVAKEILAATKIINLPVMKVHYATGITLALKNMKGCLVGAEKRRFHQIGLEKAIVDLNTVLQPALHIIDGITCMESMGPKGGDLFKLNLLVAGSNAGEVDLVGSRIMGFAPDEIRHINLYCTLHNIASDTPAVVGENPEDVLRPFKRVNMQKLIPERIKIHSCDACSSCENALLLSLKLLKQKLSAEIEIYLGSKIHFKETENMKIGFGNCCKNVQFDKHVGGCPPYPFALNRVLFPGTDPDN